MKCKVWFSSKWRGAILVIGLFTMVACGGAGKDVYQPNLPDPSVQILPLKVAVIELEDAISVEGYQYHTVNNNALIPGALYATTFVKFHPTQFGKCIAAELKGAKLFPIVDYFSTWEKLSETFRSYDLIVAGCLAQDRVEHRSIHYGLSMLSFPLLFVGLPWDQYSRDISFEVTAFEPLHPDHMLWTHQVKFEYAVYGGLYFYGYSDDAQRISAEIGSGIKITHTDFCTTEMLPPHFLALRKSLAAAVQEKMLSQGATILPKKPHGERSGS